MFVKQGTHVLHPHLHCKNKLVILIDKGLRSLPTPIEAGFGCVVSSFHDGKEALSGHGEISVWHRRHLSKP